MSLPLTPSDLQKPDVLRSQRREHIAERVGWAIIAVILTLAAIGGLGGGPLAHASRTAGSIDLAFDRLVRHGAPTELKLTVGPEAREAGKIRVAIGWEYLKGVDIRDIRPTPLGSSSRDDRLTLEFAAPQTGSSTIVFEIEPQASGQRTGWIEVGGGATIRFDQIVFP